MSIDRMKIIVTFSCVTVLILFGLFGCSRKSEQSENIGIDDCITQTELDKLSRKELSKLIAEESYRRYPEE